jgi:hypothetical protein
MNRASLAALAVATVATAGTGTGVALAGNSAGTHTLKLTAHTLKSHQSGDTFVNAEKDTQNGKTVGFDVVDCLINTTTHKGNCFAQFGLADGSLFVHVTIDVAGSSAGHGSGKVTGGTRHFKGATGTVTVSPGPTQSTTKIVITYSS